MAVMLRNAATGRLPVEHRPPARATVRRLALRFSILGPLAVSGPDGPVRLGGPRQRSLLAVLLLHANRVVSIDRLAGDLYGDAPPVTAVTQIHRQVSELRQALGSATAVETLPPGYRLRVGLTTSIWSASSGWRRTGQRRSAAATRPRRRRGCVTRSGCGAASRSPTSPTSPSRRPRSRACRSCTSARWRPASMPTCDSGMSRALAAELDALVAEHPLRERLHGLRMLRPLSRGPPAGGARGLPHPARALVDAFGIEPTPPLQELERQILRHDPALDAPPPSAPEERRRSLPGRRPRRRRTRRAARLAEPLGRAPGRELVVVQLVADADALPAAATALAGRRRALGVPARAAAFSSVDPATDVLRLETAHEVDLLLYAPSAPLTGPRLPADVERLLAGAAADVALLGAPGPGRAAAASSSPSPAAPTTGPRSRRPPGSR